MLHRVCWISTAALCFCHGSQATTSTYSVAVVGERLCLLSSPRPFSTPAVRHSPSCVDIVLGSKLCRNDNHKQLIDQVDVWGGSAKTNPRILCGIYTYEKNHFTKVKVRASIGSTLSHSIRLISNSVRCLYSVRYAWAGFVLGRSPKETSKWSRGAV